MDERPAIRERIRACGYTQLEVASGSGISPSKLSLYLRDKRELQTDSLRRLLGFLGLEVKPGRGRPGKRHGG
jgi:transcriptional regulator with XRE-family HTH domain